MGEGKVNKIQEDEMRKGRKREGMMMKKKRGRGKG